MMAIVRSAECGSTIGSRSLKILWSMSHIRALQKGFHKFPSKILKHPFNSLQKAAKYSAERMQCVDHLRLFQGNDG
jgi:hypothetical protein